MAHWLPSVVDVCTSHVISSFMTAGSVGDNLLQNAEKPDRPASSSMSSTESCNDAM